MNSRPTWDELFLEVAAVMSKRSTCSRRQVGAVITHENRIIASGYNGSPAGEPHCIDGACPRGQLTYEQLAGGSDYSSGAGKCIAIHAEENAILHATGDNVLEGELSACTIYTTDQPCSQCQTLIDYVGITHIIWERPL